MKYLANNLIERGVIHATELEQDSRTEDFFLISYPTVLLILVLAYLFIFGFVVSFLRFEHYPDEIEIWDLNNHNVLTAIGIIRFCNNTGLSLINLYLICKFIYHMFWRLDYSLLCQPLSKEGEDEFEIANLMWIFMMVKIFEWSDTLLLALNDCTGPAFRWFIHVFHHVFVVVISWFAVKYYPGGTAAVFAMYNSIAHGIAYTHLVIKNNFGVNEDQKVKWRRFIYGIALVQFALIFIGCGSAFLINCGMPQEPLIVLGFLVGSFFIENTSRWKFFTK